MFGCCVLGAAACFVMAFVLMPVLVLKPRKFVILWTVGSVLFLCRYSLGILLVSLFECWRGLCCVRMLTVVLLRYRVLPRILSTYSHHQESLSLQPTSVPSLQHSISR